MRLSFLIDPDNQLEVLSKCCNVKPPLTIDVLDEVVAADWAFTVLKFLFPVHGRLIQLDQEKARCIREFLFMNYACKLQGPKRFCILTTMFGGLRYDFEWEKGIQGVFSIARYTLASRSFEKNLMREEKLCYLGFLRLFIGDIYDLGENPKEARNTTAFLEQFRSVSLTHNMSTFFQTIYRIIRKKNAGTKGCRTSNRKLILQPECQLRWRRGIVFSRLEEQGITTATGRDWLKRIAWIEGKKWF